MKKMTKKALEDAVFRIEDEGLDYWTTNYAAEGLKGTLGAGLLADYLGARVRLVDFIETEKKRLGVKGEMDE